MTSQLLVVETLAQQLVDNNCELFILEFVTQDLENRGALAAVCSNNLSAEVGDVL